MQKIQIETDSLMQLLEPLAGIVNPSHTTEIIRCVKMGTHNNKLYVEATNLEVACINSIKFKSDLKLLFCVNYQMLTNILKTLKGLTITLKIDDLAIFVSYKGGNFKIPLDNLNEFPKIPELKDLNTAYVNGADLKSSLIVANKFIIDDNLEPMSNVSISIDKRITIRSTNRVCLFEEVLKGKGEPSNILVSGKASSSLAALLKDDEIELQYNSSHVYFMQKSMEIFAVQQQGKFPVEQFKAIIKTAKKSNVLKMQTESFKAALKRAGLMATKANEFKVKLDITGSSMEVHCSNLETESKASQKIRAIFDDERKIAYNVKYLNEVLSVFSNDVKYSITDKNSFCIKEGKKVGLLAPVLYD